MSPCADKSLRVVGRRWDSNAPVCVAAYCGQSLEEILLESVRHLRKNGQYSRTFARNSLKYCRCRVNGFEVKRGDWATAYPVEHDRIEFFLAPKGGGGGGGKNVLATILQAIVVVVAAALTWWAGGAGGVIAAGGFAGFAATVGIAAFSFGAMLLIGALFPPALPNLGGLQNDALKDSPTYSITGSRNGLNLNGFVPLILGKHRITPPLAAKSWTVWEGEVQYFHMCVCWGHTNVDISDIRISDTVLENFKDVEHVFHQATTGDDLKLFAKSYDERSVGAVLKQAGGWITRTVGEGEDISLDIAFNGLCTINEKTGKNEGRSVSLEARCRIVGTEDWYGMGQGFTLKFATFADVAWDYQPDPVWEYNGTGGFDWVYPPREYYTTYFSATTSGITSSTSDWKGEHLWSIRAGILTDHRPSYTSGFSATYNAEQNSVTISGGECSGNPSFTFSDSITKPIVRNIRKNGNPLGIYEVSMRRTTGDSTSTYVRDECTWQVSRAIKNTPAFNTPVPICVSELRIKATEQLSSYVEDLNGLAESVLPDWDGYTWTPKKTNNNASIIRYLLTNRAALNSPYTPAKLDEDTFVDFHNHCAEKGYSFNFIADAEVKTWHRLMEVAAAGRAAMTVDNDGLYGIIMDTPGKEPMQHFSPRNSWGFSIKRTFTDLPHALRLSFINEDDDYEKCEDFVYADGYTRENATDIIEWDFPGVTNWENNWKFGRYHLAQLLHRPYTMTLSTDWESRMCRRGQVVGVTHDVLMNVFGTARVQRLVFDLDGTLTLIGRVEDFPVDEDGIPLLPVGVQLDDCIVFNEPIPASYGIAIRNSRGMPVTYEIIPEYDEETDIVLFKNPLHKDIVPKLQDLCSVSILGEECLEALIAAITPGENMSAEITLVPYAIDEILAAESGDIPPYKPPIHLDVIGGSKLKAPLITEIRSDESMLTKINGRTSVQMGVWWKLDSVSADDILVHVMASREGEQKNASIPVSEQNFIAVPDVSEGEVYSVRLRISDRIGRTSPWSAAILHKVIGRTTPPPPPVRIFINGTVIRWEMDLQPLDVVGWQVFIGMDESDPFDYALQVTSGVLSVKEFDIAAYSGWARRVWICTIDELQILSEPKSVVVNLGDMPVANVIYSIFEKERHWPGEVVSGKFINECLMANDAAPFWGDEPFWS